MKSLRVAIQGCGHGDLDSIYAKLNSLQQKIGGKKADVLLVCGDFQAVRDAIDLADVACPQKYRKMGDFHRYYKQQKKAPLLTIFIGGNHEASGHLWELYHGGWAAPNIYYLGHSGSIIVNGFRITGVSGINSDRDSNLGYHNGVTKRPCPYHTRNFEIQKLAALQDQNNDIFMSHDWPHGIYEYGDLKQLLREKPFLRTDIETRGIGSPALRRLLHSLKPRYWFSAHMHVLFRATINHANNILSTKNSAKSNSEDFSTQKLKNDNSNSESLLGQPHSAGINISTQFLALDKCLPNREHLSIIDIESNFSEIQDGKSKKTKLDSFISVEYDPYWLAVVKAFDPYMNLSASEGISPTYNQVDLDAALKFVNENIFDFTIPGRWESPSQNRPFNSTISQTSAFCRLLQINDHWNTQSNDLKHNLDQNSQITSDVPVNNDFVHENQRDVNRTLESIHSSSAVLEDCKKKINFERLSNADTARTEIIIDEHGPENQDEIIL